MGVGRSLGARALLALISAGPMSRGDLAERLGLSAATTTRTVRPLIEAGLIEEQPPVEVAGPGRPTRLLAVVPSSATVAGIKLTDDRLYAVLTDPLGEVLISDSRPLTDTDAGSVTALIASVVAQLAERSGRRPDAIGISLGAAVVGRRTVVVASFLGWRDVPLAAMVSEATGLNWMPHLQVCYPARTRGQLYIPVVNVVLCVATLAVLLLFRDSEHISAAYGLALTITMITTTILLGIYLWHRSNKFGAVVFTIVFLAIQVLFFADHPKRARAWWAVAVETTDEPFTREYSVESFGTDYLFRVRIRLGFKVSQSIPAYLHQIMHDLEKTGELPNQQSIYPKLDADPGIGTIRYVVIHKALMPESKVSGRGALSLQIKYAIRRVAGSPVKWFGLAPYNPLVEVQPLFVSTRRPPRLTRVASQAPKREG